MAGRNLVKVRKDAKMNISNKLLDLAKQMAEDMKKDKIDPTPPPFFEEPGKEKKGKYTLDSAPDPGKKPKGKKKIPDGAEELERGVSGIDILPDAIEDGPVDDYEDRITLAFRDNRNIEDAFRALGEDPDIGTPTYELGTDGHSLVFHPWKADDVMKDRIKAAVKKLVDSGIAVVRDSKGTKISPY